MAHIRDHQGYCLTLEHHPQRLKNEKYSSYFSEIYSNQSHLTIQLFQPMRTVISCAWQRLHGFSLRSDWLIGIIYQKI